MPRRNKALQVEYCEPLGREEDCLAQELKKRFPGWARLPQSICRKPHLAVAYVACNPGILAEREVAECRDFARLYGRHPDQVIEALRFTRKLRRQHEHDRLEQSERDAVTQSRRVREFLLHTQFVARKGGRYIQVKNLTAADFQPGSRTLRPDKLKPVADLQDGEVAQFLSSIGLVVTTDSVKKARQSLPGEKPQMEAPTEMQTASPGVDAIFVRLAKRTKHKRAAKRKGKIS